MAILDNGSFDPIATTGGTIRNKLPASVGVLVLYNDSCVTIQVSWQNKTKRIVAQTVDIICLSDPVQLLTWKQAVIMNNAGQAPLSQVQIDAYTPDEELPYASFPVNIPRTMNLSGPATQVINDTNTAGFRVVEATESTNNSGFSNVAIDNDGSIQTYGYSSGGLREGFISISASDPTTPGQAAQIFLGDPTISAPTTQLLLETSPQLNVTKALTYKMLVGSLSRISIVSGVGPSTVNHNLGTTPNFVALTIINSLTAITLTGINATQISVNVGAGISWNAMCIAL